MYCLAGNIRKDNRTITIAHILPTKELQNWREMVLLGGLNALKNKVLWKERKEVAQRMNVGNHFLVCSLPTRKYMEIALFRKYSKKTKRYLHGMFWNLAVLMLGDCSISQSLLF